MNKETRIQDLNPESAVWNPEFKTVLDSLTGGEVKPPQHRVGYHEFLRIHLRAC